MPCGPGLLARPRGQANLRGGVILIFHDPTSSAAAISKTSDRSASPIGSNFNDSLRDLTEAPK